MPEPRRRFLWDAGAMLSGTLLEFSLAGQNPRHGLPTPPEAADPQPKATAETENRVPGLTRLREHERVFRDCLGALVTRVNQLNQEVEASHSADVFSVNVYKQSSEIEKLAKQLKSLAKG